MKKYGVLLVVIASLLAFVACSSPERDASLDESAPLATPDLNGFHFIQNEDGEYIWLGMERRDAERILTLDLASDEHAIYSSREDDGRLFVSFDEDDRVSYIQISPMSEPRWLLRDGIAQNASLSEIEQAFGENQSLNPDIMFVAYFSHDHSPVSIRDSAYTVRFALDSETQEAFGFTLLKH